VTGRSGTKAKLDERLDDDALRPSERADGLQTTVANTVVDSPPRDLQELSGLVE
jgi:hypothetical protein